MKKHKRKPACPQKSLPAKTVLLRAACCLSWLFPFAVFLAYHILAVEEETALVVPGYLGCFFLGFSLFYCVGTSKLAQLFKHGFSWKIFLPPVIIGALLTAASLALTLVPQIYARFPQKVVSDYFFLWLVLLVLGISYALFRPNVKVLLRRAEMRKADINQLTKGGDTLWCKVPMSSLLAARVGKISGGMMLCKKCVRWVGCITQTRALPSVLREQSRSNFFSAGGVRRKECSVRLQQQN